MATEIITGVCAFVRQDASPSRLVFDEAANPALAAAVSDLQLSSYCVEENKPISTVITYKECEMLVIAVAHRTHTVLVAWHTPRFMDLLAIIQGQRYDGPDALRNNIVAGIPHYNPKVPPLRGLHVYVNYPYVPLIRAFGYDGLRMLLSLAACEFTIIFIGDTLSTPSLCCFGLRAALQPLEWLGLFAPVCDPFDISRTIANEVAIVGTHNSAAPSLLLASRRGTFIANCSTGVIAPTASSAVVYTFPPSEKLKTALGDGSDIPEGVFNYWATHCIGQYRKGLNGRSFDPFKCLFPTTAGSSRERLAKAVSGTPAFGRWLTATAKDEARAPFTELCARQYPDLYPDYGGKAKAGGLGMSLFAKAKQTIRSITTDVDIRLAQYMTNSDAFGHTHHSHHGSHHGSGPVASEDMPAIHSYVPAHANEARLPLDCLVNFEAYHTLLKPRTIISTAAAVQPIRVASPPPPPVAMSSHAAALVNQPPATHPAEPAVATTGPSTIITAPAANADRHAPAGASGPPSCIATPIPEAHRAVLDLTDLRGSSVSPPPQPHPSVVVAPPPCNTSLQPQVIPSCPAVVMGAVQPNESEEPITQKYDAFEELSKLQVKPQTSPPAEDPKKPMTLDDFFT